MILFCWFCVRCGLVVRICLSCCGDMVVDIRVSLILVFLSSITFRTGGQVTRTKTSLSQICYHLHETII